MTKPTGPPSGRMDGLEADLANLVLEAPGFLVAVIDQDDRLVRANANLEALTGRPGGALPGAGLPQWAAQPLADALGRVRASGAAEELESDCRTVEGATRRVRWSLRALAQPAGWVLAVGVEMPHAQPPGPEADEEGRILEKILRTNPDFIYTYDIPENRFTFSNHELAEFLGHPSQAAGREGAGLFQALLHPDDAAQLARYRAALAEAKDGETRQVDYRLRHGDGEFHWIAERGTPLSRDPQGRVSRVLGMAEDVTAFRAAEELHQRLVEIIETTPDVLATIRPDGTLVYLNWAGRELLGLRSDDLSGASLRDLAPLEVVEQILQESIPNAAQDGYWAGDGLLNGTDGAEVAVSLVIVAHPSPQAEVEYLSLIARDVSEMRQMEAELRRGRDELELRVAERTAELHRSETLYRTLIEAAPDMVYILARDGQLEYLNPVAVEYFKRPAGELLGRFITELFPTTAALQHQSDVLRVIKTGQPYTSENKFHFPEGERWFNTILAPIHDDDGSIESVLCVSRDVTSRKQIEDELYQSRQMLQLILDNIPQRVFWKDRELRFLGANRPFLHDLGVDSLQEILGKDDLALIGPAEAELRRAEDRQVLESGVEKLNDEEPQASEDGETLWLRTSRIPLRDRDGLIFGVLGTSEDITERKRAEALLAARNEELIRSNADLEQFAYIASHDLQEPLRMVASFAQLFARRYQGTLDERGEKYLSYVVEGAYRMQQLIDDLLTYSRVGTRAKAFVPVNCNFVVSQVLFNMQVVVRETGAQVNVEMLPTVQADESQVFQLFQNLIGNAIKFHGAAAPEVHIWAEREGEAWRFGVADNGIGIEPQFAERVFVIFQRLHSREKYPGTGIGLAVCKKIIQRHGGRIWLESVPGEGTTFYFTFPDQPESAG